MKFAASAIALVAALMIVAFQPVEARTRISAWQGQFVDNVAARQAAALCGYTPTKSEMDPGPLGGKGSPKKKQKQLLKVLAPGIQKAVAHRCPGSLLEADGPETEPEMIPTPTETYQATSSVPEAVYEAAEAVAEAKVEEAQRMAETYQATSSVPEAVYEAAEAVAEAKVERAAALAEFEPLAQAEQALRSKLAAAANAEANAVAAGEDSEELAQEVAELAREDARAQAELATPQLAVLAATLRLHGAVARSAWDKHVAPRITPMAGAIAGKATAIHSLVARNLGGGGAAGGGAEEQVEPVTEAVALFLLLLPVGCWFAWLAYVIASSNTIVDTLCMYGNYFWAAYCNCLLVAVALAGQEPMLLFHQQDPGLYVLFQFVKMFVYITHMLMLCAKLARAPGLFNLVQLSGVTLVGLHDYTFAWFPAMREEAPTLTWRSYVLYVWVYAVVCLVPQTRRQQKQAFE